MSNVPLVRERLEDLAQRLSRSDPAAAREIRSLIPLLWREPLSRKRAPEKSDKMTAEKAALIRAYAAANPAANHDEIAAKFNVNHGRVSDALAENRRIRHRAAS